MSDFLMYALVITITSVVIFAMCNAIKPLFIELKELRRYH